MTTSNLLWIGFFVGFFVWVLLVYVLVDPLLRKVLIRVSGIAIERSRGPNMGISFSSATPHRGEAIAFFWDWILYFLCVLPIVAGVLVMAVQWYAEHPKGSPH